MKLLELFSGTGSVGKVAKDFGFEVVSLDRDMNADIKTDIMDWDYKVYPPQYFDIIWASPPCTEYSRAKTIGVRKIAESNRIVKKVLEIINYFDPIYFLIENPQSGLLKNQSFMKDLPYDDLDYCKYGMPYRKRTRIWNNIYGWKPKSLCKKDCGNIEDGRHKEHAQRGPSGNNKIRHKQTELYVIPPLLLTDIFFFISLCMSTP
jgi:hypothetical protein